MIAWFTKNDVAANLLMISILLVGIWSAFTQIPLEVFPDSELRTVTVGMVFRGATPAEVEEGVLVPIEEAIQSIESIKEIRSHAGEGGGSVTAEIKSGYDPRVALDEIKSEVDAIVTFPAETEAPTVSLQKYTDSVVKVLLYGDLEEAQLRELADSLRDEIVGRVGTSKVEMPRWIPLHKLPILSSVFQAMSKTETINSASIIGVRPFEIAIEVAEETLLRYDLTLGEVAAAVSSQSVDLSGGTIKTLGGEILLRTKSKAYVGKDFEEIVVRSNPDGTKVRVRDLGTVTDGFEENQVVARFNGKPSVLISVERVGEQNAIIIADTVKDFIEERRSTLPEGVSVETWRDRSNLVEARLDTLVRNGIGAFLLVFIILSLFLRFQLGLWVMLGIPVALCGAFICMPLTGTTINIVSLFGFILVLGILVDDAIVTGENIFTRMREDKDGNPTLAAIEGTREVTRPVVFGVLTTIVAFVPVMLIPGPRGAQFQSIPAVVIPVLLFSLIESKLILPAHLKHMRPEEKKVGKWNWLLRIQQKVARGMELFTAKAYQPFLERCLVNRFIVLATFIVVLMISIGWWKSGRIRYVWFPRIASEYLTVRLNMPIGTPFAVTEGHIDRMEAAAFELQKKYVGPDGSPLISHIFSSTGSQGITTTGGPGGNRGLRSGQSHIGELSLEVVDREVREKLGLLDVTPRSISMELRRMIGQIPGAEDLNIKAEIGRTSDPIDIRLSGLNELELEGAAAAVKAKLAEFSGLFDIASNVDDGKQEIRLNVKPEAQLLGIDADNLARQTRGAFFGFEAQRIQRGRDDVRVMVRYPPDGRESLPNLNEMRVRTPDGARVPFANVAEVEFGRSPARISRVDRQRTVNIKADADKEKVDLGAIKAAINEDMERILAPVPSVSSSQEGDAAEP
ncbi:MAG: efflux RND transporter permease subunit, partial [Verrucomicrobiota bacterium]